MDNVNNKLYERMKTLLYSDAGLSEPILYTLAAKVAGGSLASHGIDCYHLGKFTELSDDQVLDMATATELAWTIILMFDDILDNDSIRYGKETSWVKFGKEQTQMSIKYGLRVATNLHPYQEPFIKMYEQCIGAMNGVKALPIDSSTTAVEKAYEGYTFGCYDYLLPFTDEIKQILTSVGYKEMLITQLINDYKDTCGSRRVQRDYPELRERQANYITALHIDSLDQMGQEKFSQSIKQASGSKDYEQIAQVLKASNPKVISKISDLQGSITRELQMLPASAVKDYMNRTIEDLMNSLEITIQAEFNS